jgi:hypothetical protein
MKILLLFSSTDTESLQVYERIRDIEPIKTLTVPIDVSNQTANTIIRNSSNIKVSEIPVIFVYGNGKVDKYEGMKSVSEFITQIEKNINDRRTRQKVEEEVEEVEEEEVSDNQQYKTTKISDLNLEIEDKPAQQQNTIDQGPPRPNIQNMPIKSKRSTKQNKSIDQFMNQRKEMNSNVNQHPSRIQITSPKMEQPTKR